MYIKINLPDGKIITLEVSPDETILSIKAKIQEITGIPIDKQGLKKVKDKGLNLQSTSKDSQLDE